MALCRRHFAAHTNTKNYPEPELLAHKVVVVAVVVVTTEAGALQQQESWLLQTAAKCIKGVAVEKGGSDKRSAGKSFGLLDFRNWGLHG